MSPATEERYRAPLLWLLAPYLLGLMLAATGAGAASPLAVGVAALLAGVAVVVSFREGRRATWTWGALLAGAAALGGMVHMRHALDPGGAESRWSGMPTREIRIAVEVTRLFASGDEIPGRQTRQLCLGEIVQAPEPFADLSGRRVCFALEGMDALHAAVVRSAELQLDGVLRRIEANPAEDADGFEAYLRQSGVNFVLERARLRHVVAEAGPVATMLHRANHRFAAILTHGLPEDHSATAVYVAMFLGQKSELSDAQQENFLRSGTMHLFAISGLHIAVIAACLQCVLVVARLPTRAWVVIGLILLWIFVEATGGMPSARRAFLMIAFLWAGRVLRRPANAFASLVTSACVVLVWDPLAVLSASFQLSYAVVAALLLYGLPLRQRWHAAWQPWRALPLAEWRWWHRVVNWWVRGALSVLALSCSATLISTPLSIAYFGLASPGAVISNLVLVPITSGAISAGFASLVCGLVGATGLSAIFNHAGAMILAIVDFGAAVAAATPGMSVAASFSARWMAPLVVLALLIVLVAGYARGWMRFPLRWWAPPATLILLVGLLVTWGAPVEESASMKSAYELAMERLKKADPNSAPELTAEQKAKLAEIDRVYQGKIAEREIFLQQRLAEAQTANQPEEREKIRQQIASERARLEEDREDEKNRVRRAKA